MKKTKGLKKELKARKKIMAQPDVMHDFGALGKWSESTLKANFESAFAYTTDSDYKRIVYIIPVIENTYSEKWTDYGNCITSLETKRYWFPKLDTLYEDFKELELSKSKLNKLCFNYREYQRIMEMIF